MHSESAVLYGLSWKNIFSDEVDKEKDKNEGLRCGFKKKWTSSHSLHGLKKFLNLRSSISVKEGKLRSIFYVK